MPWPWRCLLQEEPASPQHRSAQSRLCPRIRDTHSDPTEVCSMGASPSPRLQSWTFNRTSVPSLTLGVGGQSKPHGSNCTFISFNRKYKMPKKLWHPHNVFQYTNQNSIYVHQKRKLCAYVLNTTQPTHIMWTEHTEILLGV